jgi:hypothetical protein
MPVEYVSKENEHCLISPVAMPLPYIENEHCLISPVAMPVDIHRKQALPDFDCLNNPR